MTTGAMDVQTLKIGDKNSLAEEQHAPVRLRSLRQSTRELMEQEASDKNPFVLYPEDDLKDYLDLMISIVACYIFVIMPLQLAFVEWRAVSPVWQWSTSLALICYWIDLFFSLFLSYVEPDGTYEHDLNTVIWANLTDISKMSDWMCVFSMFSLFGSYSMYFNVFAYPRLWARLASSDMAGFVYLFLERRFKPAVPKLMKFTALFIICTHALACVWFSMGEWNCLEKKHISSTFHPDLEDHSVEELQHGRCDDIAYVEAADGTRTRGWLMSWNDSYGASDPVFSRENWFRQYLVSLYFIVTVSTTVGFGDVLPVSSQNNELVFTMLLELSGLVWVGILLSLLTELIIEDDVVDDEVQHNMKDLIVWLHAGGISGNIANEAVRKMNKVFRVQIGHRPRKIDVHHLIEHMPFHLREKLQSIMHEKIVEKCVIFKPFADDFERGDFCPLELTSRLTETLEEVMLPYLNQTEEQWELFEEELPITHVYILELGTAFVYYKTATEAVDHSEEYKVNYADFLMHKHSETASVVPEDLKVETFNDPYRKGEPGTDSCGRRGEFEVIGLYEALVAEEGSCWNYTVHAERFRDEDGYFVNDVPLKWWTMNIRTFQKVLCEPKYSPIYDTLYKYAVARREERLVQTRRLNHGIYLSLHDTKDDDCLVADIQDYACPHSDTKRKISRQATQNRMMVAGQKPTVTGNAIKEQLAAMMKLSDTLQAQITQLKQAFQVLPGTEC